MSPARTIAPAIALGIYSHLVAPLLGTMFGGLVAGMMYSYLYLFKPEQVPDAYVPFPPILTVSCILNVFSNSLHTCGVTPLCEEKVCVMPCFCEVTLCRMPGTESHVRPVNTKLSCIRRHNGNRAKFLSARPVSNRIPRQP